MADSIGEFAFSHMGSTYAKNDDGVIVASVNYEGTATGFGTVFGTLTFPLVEGGAKSGTCAWNGQGFPPDRPWVSGGGDGTWEQVEGRYAWKISLPDMENSDGSRIRAEGELDLEGRTFSGEMFDAS
ncbi:MAG: hypothetical protein O7H40_14445 [Gammaproteobacteria bacterium]|nr:hypothetical protein [Gammaproteobacteria bacterium]